MYSVSNHGLAGMFGKKQKSKNKFHLPVEEPKAEPAASTTGTLFSDAMTPEIYAADGVADEDQNESTSTVLPPKYRFITSEGKLTEKKPTRNWEIYYRDRNYAGGVGDPLITVVEASSRQEAESKAQMKDGNDVKSEIIAVNTNNAIIRYKKESAFAYPSTPTDTERPSKAFRDKI